MGKRLGAASLGLVLVLGACAGDGATRATVGLGVACDSVAQSIKAVSPHIAKGELSQGQVDSVVNIRNISAPLCRSGSAVDPATAYNLVSGFATQLVNLRKELSL